MFLPFLLAITSARGIRPLRRVEPVRAPMTSNPQLWPLLINRFHKGSLVTASRISASIWSRWRCCRLSSRWYAMQFESMGILFVDDRGCCSRRVRSLLRQKLERFPYPLWTRTISQVGVITGLLNEWTLLNKRSKCSLAWLVPSPKP